jgi:hypothetical protein
LYRIVWSSNSSCSSSFSLGSSIGGISIAYMFSCSLVLQFFSFFPRLSMLMVAWSVIARRTSLVPTITTVMTLLFFSCMSCLGRRSLLLLICCSLLGCISVEVLRYSVAVRNGHDFSLCWHLQIGRCIPRWFNFI